jgi:RNA polymerase sigma-70 factor (ECF subfamily)
MRPTDGPEPEEQLRLARHGDATAFGALVGRYADYLTLLARLQVGRRLQGKVEPADLVQEAFLKAHRDFPTFRGTTEAEFVAWLRQLLATAVAGQVRRFLGARQRDVRLEQQLVDEMDQSSRALDGGLVAGHSTPSRQATRREQALVLADALGKLPEHYREVIVLHHLEGLTLAQVARRMGRTPDSVEKLWTRALVQLRDLLGASP